MLAPCFVMLPRAIAVLYSLRRRRLELRGSQPAEGGGERGCCIPSVLLLCSFARAPDFPFFLPPCPRFSSLTARPQQRPLEGRQLPNGKVVPNELIKSDPSKSQGQDLTVRRIMASLSP